MAKRRNSVNIITPETQQASLNGQLNTGVKTVLGTDFVLNDLADVVIKNASENDIIFFDGVQWVNKPIDKAMQVYTWVLDGGGAFDDDEPQPDPGPEPGTYAEKSSVVLYNFINSEQFQLAIEDIKGLDSMNMEGNSINLVISDNFTGLYDMLYEDEDINSVIGRMVSTIYDNMSKTIRYSLDDIATDVWISYQNYLNEKEAGSVENDKFNTKLFIYFSDASVIFYDINITFV